MNKTQKLFLFTLYGYATIGVLIASIFDSRYNLPAFIMSLSIFVVIFKILGSDGNK